MQESNDRKLLYERDGDLCRGAFIDSVRVQAPWAKNAMPYRCTDPGWQPPRRRVGQSSAGFFSYTNSQKRRFLLVEASLPKVLQGHNLFLPYELGLQIPKFLFAAEESFSTDQGGIAKEWFEWLRGGYYLNRVDCTGMFHLGTHKAVGVALDALAFTHHEDLGEAWRVESSVYFGRKGGEHILRFYDKEAELQVEGHQLPGNLALREQLLEFARGTLRVEVQFKRAALDKRGLRDPRQWHPLLPGRLLRGDLAKLSMGPCHELTKEQILALPAHLQKTARHYLAGESCQELLSRATFYRHRSRLLSLGIDINYYYDEDRARKYLETNALLERLGWLPFRGVPDWAQGTPVCDELGVLSF